MRVETDAGEAFIKTLGNPEGPHALASEWVGSRLAELLGMPTLDFTLITIDAGVELPMAGAGNAQPGPARYEQIAPLVESITDEWDAGLSVREAWVDLLLQRAAYVATSLVPKVFP